MAFSTQKTQKPKTLYSMKRKAPADIYKAIGILAPHLLSLWAPFHFTWAAVWVAFGLFWVTGLGITLSYHRNLCHRSFKLPKWLEYSFAYFGAHALQGDPIDWVSIHRYHHKFVDTERDPHSPIQGFWYSHISWAFDSIPIDLKCGGKTNVGDLKKQPFYRFLEKTYVLHILVLGAALYALGGLPFLVWGMGVRIVVLLQITWMINSVAHTWGTQAWNTDDNSRNVWWLGVLAHGEGWHNNHHAFEFSARQGLEWWQMDVTWYIIRSLEIIGLATDVKLPTETQKQRMTFKT